MTSTHPDVRPAPSSHLATADRAHRALAAGGLVGSALLLSASVVLQPDATGSGGAVLAHLHDAGWRAGASAASFALGQLPYAAAALGIGHLLRTTAPRLGVWGAALSLAGAFGHAVFGGISLVYVVMAGQASADESSGRAYAHLVDTLSTSPVMSFSLLGLAGFAVGLLLLSIGLFRGKVGPRWTGPAVWAFLVVELVGTTFSHAASYLSSALLLAVFLTLAWQAWSSWDVSARRA